MAYFIGNSDDVSQCCTKEEAEKYLQEQIEGGETLDSFIIIKGEEVKLSVKATLCE